MPSPRRIGAETSKTRAVLLDNTERLMLEEGYAGVSYRTVAAISGVTPWAVQYYFPTLDDLFLALLRGRTERNLEELAESLKAHPDEPLRLIWDHSNDEVTAGLMLEFMALANHRKSIRAEITDVGRRLRKVWLDAVPGPGTRYKLPAIELPASVLLFMLAGIPKLLLLEAAFDLSMGHRETVDLVNEYLGRTEPEGAGKASATSAVRVRTKPQARSSKGPPKTSHAG